MSSPRQQQAFEKLSALEKSSRPDMDDVRFTVRNLSCAVAQENDFIVSMQTGAYKNPLVAWALYLRERIGPSGQAPAFENFLISGIVRAVAEKRTALCDVLLQNLAEERGLSADGSGGFHIDSARAHVVLRDHARTKLCEALASRAGSAAPLIDSNSADRLPTTQAYLDGLASFAKYRLQSFVGAAYTIERMIADEYAKIVPLLRRDFAPGITDQDIFYFTDHASHDIGHSKALEESMAAMLKEPMSSTLNGVRPDVIFSGIRLMAELKLQFFDGLYAAIIGHGA